MAKLIVLTALTAIALAGCDDKTGIASYINTNPPSVNTSISSPNAEAMRHAELLAEQANSDIAASQNKTEIERAHTIMTLQGILKDLPDEERKEYLHYLIVGSWPEGDKCTTASNCLVQLGGTGTGNVTTTGGICVDGKGNTRPC